MDRIDLHCHTTSSDGTDSPKELVRKAKELGRAIHALVHGKDCPKHRDDNKDALDNPEQFLFQRFEVIPELF